MSKARLTEIDRAYVPCRYCGVQILWYKRPDGSNHPPVIAISDVLGLDENQRLVKRVAFVRHYCNPDDVDRWAAKEEQRRKEERERREAGERGRLVAKAARSMADEAHRLAVQVDCPRCPAKEGEECLNLNVLMKRATPKNQRETTRWPHPERSLLADEEGVR